MTPADFFDRILGAVRDAASAIPPSAESASPLPDARARAIGKAAALKAAALSGTLAIPPGPAGLLTLLPDLVLMFRIQNQMVADVAAVYGKTACLNREGMMYCLFRHAAAQALRGLVVRRGERMLLERAGSAAAEGALRRVAASVGERLVSRSLSRWIPLVGAFGVGAYAYFDTMRIARTAGQFFASDVEVAA